MTVCIQTNSCKRLSELFCLLSAALFAFCRLDLARCSATHRCGLWGVQASFPSSCWGGPHPLFWLSARIQHCWKVPAKWSATQMQSEKETWVHKGQTGRAHTPQAGRLVRGSALDTFWDSPIGGNWQKFREEGRWLVWALYSGSYTTVRALEKRSSHKS